MAAPVSPYPILQFFDSNGDPLASGTLETYAAGTSTPKATYSDSALITSNPTTITLDSAGRTQVSGTTVAVFLSTGGYKFVLKTATGTTVWTADGIVGAAVTPTILSKMASYAVVTTDGDDVLVTVDATAGAATISLYTAVGNTGKRIAVKKIDTSTHAVTIDPNSTETMDGATTITISGRYDTIQLESDGANWQVVSRPSTVPVVAEGRLTLTTAVPITSGDVSAAVSAFYTPCTGNHLSLYDGTSWHLYTFTEITISLAGKTAATPYDVFAVASGATVTIELTAWTNASTRATALVRQDGALVKSGDATRRYLGSIYINASGGQTDDTLAKRYVWNCFNRALRPLQVTDSTDSWTYTTNTFRQANNSASNQIALMVGVAEDAVDVSVFGTSVNGTTGTDRFVSIGEDNTTSLTTAIKVPLATTERGVSYARLLKVPAEGFHFYAWLEASTAAGTTSWYGDGGDNLRVQAGITGLWRS